MINFLYQKLLRIFYLLINFRNFFIRPIKVGVCVAIINTRGKILLVKHSYKNGWFVPGGFIKKLETFEDTGIREIKEELGIDIKKESLKFLKTGQTFQNYKTQVTVSFVVQDISDEIVVKIDKKEIIEAKWFSLKDLPNDLYTESAEIIALLS